MQRQASRKKPTRIRSNHVRQRLTDISKLNTIQKVMAKSMDSCNNIWVTEQTKLGPSLSRDFISRLIFFKDWPDFTLLRARIPDEIWKDEYLVKNCGSGMLVSALYWIRPNMCCEDIKRMKKEECRRMYFEDDTRCMHFMMVDGFWKILGKVFETRHRGDKHLLPKYLEFLIDDGKKLVVHTDFKLSNLGARPMVCAMNLACKELFNGYNNTGAARIVHCHKFGAKNKSINYLITDSTGFPRNIKTDERILKIILRCLGEEDPQAMYFLLFSYLWRWLAVQFISNSSYYSIPRLTFNNEYISEEMERDIKELLSHKSDYFSGTNEPRVDHTDTEVRFPSSLCVWSTLTTIRAARYLLLNQRHHETKVPLLGVKMQFGSKPIMMSSKLSMISKILEDFIIQSSQLLCMSKMATTLKPRFLMKDNIAKKKRLKIEVDDDTVIITCLNNKSYTTKELLDECGVSRGLDAISCKRGRCPHLKNNQNVMFVVDLNNRDNAFLFKEVRKLEKTMKDKTFSIVDYSDFSNVDCSYIFIGDKKEDCDDSQEFSDFLRSTSTPMLYPINFEEVIHACACPIDVFRTRTNCTKCACSQMKRVRGTEVCECSHHYLKHRYTHSSYDFLYPISSTNELGFSFAFAESRTKVELICGMGKIELASGYMNGFSYFTNLIIGIDTNSVVEVKKELSDDFRFTS